MNRTITDLASSHGIKTYQGNGDNILEVVEVTREAKNYILTNSKPAFIEFSTYRLLEHCGPNFDDDLNYRDPSDVKNFTRKLYPFNDDNSTYKKQYSNYVLTNP
jgi:pyruvate dehydrogenase E1 component alpha subunit